MKGNIGREDLIIDGELIPNLKGIRGQNSYFSILKTANIAGRTVENLVIKNSAIDENSSKFFNEMCDFLKNAEKLSDVQLVNNGFDLDQINQIIATLGKRQTNFPKVFLNIVEAKNISDIYSIEQEKFSSYDGLRLIEIDFGNNNKISYEEVGQENIIQDSIILDYDSDEDGKPAENISAPKVKNINSEKINVLNR